MELNCNLNWWYEAKASKFRQLSVLPSVATCSVQYVVSADTKHVCAVTNVTNITRVVSWLTIKVSLDQGRGVHVTGVSAAYTFKLNKNILSE
jgi:hypothetical protein